MPSLLPTSSGASVLSPVSAGRQVSFGRSWRFDFERGDFVPTATGGVAMSSDVQAWVEWCRKALMTARYRHLAYGRAYGQEFEDLIGRGLTREAAEAEIRRMVTECLTVDPRTASVGAFSFDRAGDAVYVTCEITSVRGEGASVGARVVVS